MQESNFLYIMLASFLPLKFYLFCCCILYYEAAWNVTVRLRKFPPGPILVDVHPSKTLFVPRRHEDLKLNSRKFLPVRPQLGSTHECYPQETAKQKKVENGSING